MKKWNDVYRMVKNGDLDASLLKTGCENLKAARERATHVMEGFKESFGATEDTMVALCSAPGRTEICGNHTDHQHGDKGIRLPRRTGQRKNHIGQLDIQRGKNNHRHVRIKRRRLDEFHQNVADALPFFAAGLEQRRGHRIRTAGHHHRVARIEHARGNHTDVSEKRLNQR